MPIKSIKIKNCKSIKEISVELNNINCIVGENGTGKSNLMKAVTHFYKNLVDINIDKNIIDKLNPYNYYGEITVTYDFNKLLIIANNREKKDEDLNPFFKKVFSFTAKFADENGLVKATLKHYKDNTLIWNIPYDLRSFLKNVFPIYMIETRHINLTDWDELWEIIGDLSKIKSSIDDELIDKLSSVFKEFYGDNFLKVLKYIKNELDTNNIDLKKFNLKQKFINFYQIEFGGKTFTQNGQELNFYSDGINSYNYIKLFISLISKISQRKIKEPLLVIDEPEIGLHPKFIDDLAATFETLPSSVRLLISTHSPRMVRNIMNGINENSIFHISSQNEYTSLKRMRNLSDKRQNYKISEKEASYYFSRAIVCVEGATEIELFSNRNLNELFPFLKEVDFYSFDSDNVKLKTILPNEMNISIPYLLIIDLDKVINYNVGKGQFNIRRDFLVNPLGNSYIQKKEKYYYGIKRSNTYFLRKRIDGILKTCIFDPDSDWGYIEDDYFWLLKKLINEYCLQYNVFTFETTIEGAIINNNINETVYDWLLKNRDQSILNEVYTHKEDTCYRNTALRLIFEGKYDNLVTKIETQSSDAEKIKFKINEIKNQKKTNGWVTEFVNYFFENYINNCNHTKQARIDSFKDYFPELFKLIDKIEEIVK
ncbi:retron Eco8 family effector endonuclease [Brassicibacter mesophilus]|uniref:retron Eco8 family effector endonuclease n=1 Tax=Brassicibacter mesophilus TaxID=745119 RepID=UPI003D233254